MKTKTKNWLLATSVGTFVMAFLAVTAEAQTMSMDPAGHEPLIGHVLVDEFEYRVQDGNDVLSTEMQAWYGGDYNKVWLEFRGESQISESVEEAEVQLLYTRLIGYYWDFQGGVRYDIKPDPSRAYGQFGFQGLAPGYFEVDVKGFVSEEGDLSARFEAEYDLYVTQRLVLQPALEVNFAAQSVPELGIGSGVNDIELGLRLRYEVFREFAPYVGINYERKFAETADFAREEGEDTSSFQYVAGVRFWF